MVDEIKYILKVETSDGVEKLSVELDDAAKELEVLKKGDGVDLINSIKSDWQSSSFTNFKAGYYDNRESVGTNKFYKKHYSNKYNDKIQPVNYEYQYYYNLDTNPSVTDRFYQYDGTKYVVAEEPPKDGELYSIDRGYYNQFGDNADKQFYRDYSPNPFVFEISPATNTLYYDLLTNSYYVYNGSSYVNYVGSLGAKDLIESEFAELRLNYENRLDTFIKSISADINWESLVGLSQQHFKIINDEQVVVADSLGVNNPLTSDNIISQLNNKVNKLATAPSKIVPILYSPNGELIDSVFGEGSGTFCEGNDTRLTDKALIDHASSDPIHGEGSSTKYGHVKLQRNLSTLDENNGAVNNQAISNEFNHLIDVINQLIELISSDSPDISRIE